MTMTMTMPDRSSRWLLVGSLALNLFFVGTIGALALTRSLSSLLFGVAPEDATTMASVLAVLTAVALLASWLPARNAARVSPIDALRTE